MKPAIYIAGPYTTPDPCINTHNAIKMADHVLELGGVPFVPHLFHFWHTISPKPYETWMEMDLEFLNACDALFRIPGESPGANREVQEAFDRKIPVILTESGLIKFIDEWNSR
jgi:nucleoside 2-deoxyribosyltransferase